MRTPARPTTSAFEEYARGGSASFLERRLRLARQTVPNSPHFMETMQCIRHSPAHTTSSSQRLRVAMANNQYTQTGPPKNGLPIQFKENRINEIRIYTGHAHIRARVLSRGTPAAHAGTPRG